MLANASIRVLARSAAAGNVARAASALSVPIRSKSEPAVISSEAELKAIPSSTASKQPERVPEPPKKVAGPWQRFVALCVGAALASGYYFYELQETALADQQALWDELERSHAAQGSESRQLKERLAVLEHEFAKLKASHGR